MSEPLDKEKLAEIALKARLGSLKARKDQLKNQTSTTKKVLIVLFIVVFPVLYFYYEKWAAVRKCNMFDNELISRYETARPEHIEVEGYQLAMALRGSLAGLWKLVFFGASDNSVKFARMLQYYNRTNLKVADGSGTLMKDIMAQPERAAIVIQTLYSTNQTQGSTEAIMDMVCNSGLDESYVPSECIEKKDGEEDKDCGKSMGVAALDGAMQSLGCVFSGNPPMIAGCVGLTFGASLFGGATAGGCF